jgi:hypothetical protein
MPDSTVLVIIVALAVTFDFISGFPDTASTISPRS